MEFVTWIFFGPAKLIALWPYAGVAIAAGLIAAQSWRNLRTRQPFNGGFFRTAPVFAGVLWLIFNAFELQMSAIAVKTGNPVMRLDLIVLVPILYVLTGAAALSLVPEKIRRLIQLRGTQGLNSKASSTSWTS